EFDRAALVRLHEAGFIDRKSLVSLDRRFLRRESLFASFALVFGLGVLEPARTAFRPGALALLPLAQQFVLRRLASGRRLPAAPAQHQLRPDRGARRSQDSG